MKKIVRPLKGKINKILSWFRLKCRRATHAKSQPALQTLLMLAGVIVAGVLGYEQNAISDRQNQINNALLEINMKPRINVHYDSNTKELYFENKGQYNLGIASIAYDGEKFESPSLPINIASESRIALKMEARWPTILALKDIIPSKSLRVHEQTNQMAGKKFSTYIGLRIQDELHNKYLLIVKMYFYTDYGNEKDVTTQSLGITKDAWNDETFNPPHDLND